MKTHTEDQRYCYKILFWLIKYVPIVSALMLWIHIMLLLCFGINEQILCNLFDSSIPRCLVMVVASYAFGFCLTHRLFILYNLLVTMAIDYNGMMLLDHQIFFALAGIALFVVVWNNRKDFIRCCGNAKGTYRQILEDSSRRY